MHALRLSDETGLLRPASVDPRSGYRFYQPSQAADATAACVIEQVLESLARGDRVAAHERVEQHRAGLQARHLATRTLVASLHGLIDEEEPDMADPAGASSDDQRPALMSVLFEGAEGGLRMVATDLYRMAVVDLPGVGVLDDGRQVLIPATLLLELAANLPADGRVGVAFGDGDVVFDVGGGQHVASETVDLERFGNQAATPAGGGKGRVRVLPRCVLLLVV